MLHSPPLASNLVIPLYLSVHENGQWNLEKKKRAGLVLTRLARLTAHRLSALPGPACHGSRMRSFDRPSPTLHRPCDWPPMFPPTPCCSRPSPAQARPARPEPASSAWGLADPAVAWPNCAFCLELTDFSPPKLSVSAPTHRLLWLPFPGPPDKTKQHPAGPGASRAQGAAGPPLAALFNKFCMSSPAADRGSMMANTDTAMSVV